LSSAFVQFGSGALSMGYAVSGLFFLRYWRDSRDRLFVFFSGAFFLLALQGLVQTFLRAGASIELPSYYLRLAAFLLILAGILDKNLRR